MKVYLDNAATTPMDPEVIEEMVKYMRDEFGNPSSTHSYGRRTRAALDLGRKKVANMIHAEPGEIIFTSGGTEADNMAIMCSVNDLGVTHIITSPIEHHAVLYPVERLAEKGLVRMSLVKIDDKGHVDLDHLESLLQTSDKTLVTLMHANNEIGNILPLKKVSDLCLQHGAYLHTDTVQTIAHYPINLKETPVHFMTCAAHKFHGPKGVGFLYINSSVKIKPMIHGGGQERNMRAGTENVYGIMGMVKALELAYQHIEEHTAYIKGLKLYMMEALKKEIPDVRFNGDAAGESLYTVLNVVLPASDKNEMMLFNLDIEGIATSGGSACSSGSNIGSHVLAALPIPPDRPVVRFSFSKYNTREEIDHVISKIKAIYALPSLV